VALGELVNEKAMCGALLASDYAQTVKENTARPWL